MRNPMHGKGACVCVCVSVSHGLHAVQSTCYILTSSIGKHVDIPQMARRHAVAYTDTVDCAAGHDMC